MIKLMKTSIPCFLISAFLLIPRLELLSKPAGDVIGWGDNLSGQVTGVPSGYNATTGIVMVAGQTLTNIMAVSVGGGYSLGLASDGTVFGWGDNCRGKSIGITNEYPYRASGQVTVGGKPLTDVEAIAAGRTHSIALKNDGTVATWGTIYSGKPSSVPLDLSNVVAIAAGEHGSLVLKNDGTVEGWDMWIPPTRYKISVEDRQVPEGLSNIVAIAAAPGFFANNLALTKDGTVKEWRSLSRATLVDVAGLSNVVAIAAGDGYGLALKRNGTVAAWSDHESLVPPVPTGLTNVVAIAAGGNSGPPAPNTFALALKNDGTVVAWGQMNLHPATVPEGLSNVVAIAAGDNFCLAITTNSAVAERFKRKN